MQKIMLFLKLGFESELMLIPYLCDKNKISIDVGANLGIYSHYMKKFSSKCWAFEPNPELSRDLKKIFGDKVIVKQIALSNTLGKTKLRFPANDTGKATIENENLLVGEEKINTIEVEQNRLDDFDLDTIGVIKIDVEGHEESVLSGSKKYLIRDKPVLIIELEERHKPNTIKNVNKLLSDLDYHGFFFLNNRLHPIKIFDKDKYQNSKKENQKNHVYVNNFVFLSDKDMKKVSKFL